MAERDDYCDREFNLSPAEASAAARDRARKLQILRRIGAAVGRPIEDFFARETERAAAEDEPEGGGRER